MLNSAGGVKTGDEVTLYGMRIGNVTEVRFSEADPRKGVMMKIHIDDGFKIPADVSAYVSHGLMGGSSVDLRSEAAVATTAEYLPVDGSAKIGGRAEGQTLVDEFRPAIKNLASLADSVNELLNAPVDMEATTTGPTTGASTVQGSIATTRPQKALQLLLVNLNRTLQSVDDILGDKENQSNIKRTLADLRELTSSAKLAVDDIKAFTKGATVAVQDAQESLKVFNKTTTQAGQDFRDLAQKLIKDAEDVSTVLTTLNGAFSKMEKGDGTAGKLLNDPKLYNNLVDVTNQMSSLMQEFRQLVQQWKESGMAVKLK